MFAVAGVQAIAVQVTEEDVKQVPKPPVGVTVMETLSPPVNPATW